MAVVAAGYTFGTTEEVTAAKLATLLTSATVSNIVNADIDGSAAIADSKLAQITTASKVSGAALTLLTSVPSGAGLLPSANLPTSKIITSTRDMTAASGNVSYTGVGFTPRTLLVFASKNAATLNFSSIGFSDASKSIYSLYTYTTAGLHEQNNYFIGLYETGVLGQLVTAIVSYDSDGFTLTWSKVGSPSAGTASLAFLCIG